MTGKVGKGFSWSIMSINDFQDGLVLNSYMHIRMSVYFIAYEKLESNRILNALAAHFRYLRLSKVEQTMKEFHLWKYNKIT